MTDNAKDLPSTPRAEYEQAAPDITLIRTLLGGTRPAHTAYSALISKYSAETPESFQRRATSTKLYGGLARTLSASVGMLFAKPPELIDRWTEQLKSHWENIDGKGTHGDVFAKRIAEDAIVDGDAGILVDFPPIPEGVAVTAANEEALNLRPFWARYQRSDILSWRTAIVNNVETPVQIVLREGSAVDDGTYGVTLDLQYRVLYLSRIKDVVTGQPMFVAAWKLLQEEVSGSGRTVTGVRIVDEGAFLDKAGQPFDEIPFAVAYAGRTDAMFTAHPPLLDVAWANWDHFRTATNLQFYEDMCCFPQPAVEGELAASGQVSATGIPIALAFKLGPGVLVQTAVGSKFSFVELAGSSLDQLRQSLQEKKQEIADLGMSFLAKNTRGVETFEAKRLDATAENSTLATSAQGIEDGINQALVFHARYLGIEAKQSPTIKINRDFENSIMDSATMTAVATLVNAGMPVIEAARMLQTGGRIAPDVDLEVFAMQWEVGVASTAVNAASQNLPPAPMAPAVPEPKPPKSVRVKRDSQGRVSRLVTSEN